MHILARVICSVADVVFKRTLPFSLEYIEARRASGAYASALRRLSKRRQAVSTATPFSAAIVGLGDTYSYRNRVLCYLLDTSLRVLDLHAPVHKEVVVDIPRLLKLVLPETEQSTPGRFQVLYYSDNIVSCLFKPTDANLTRWLIVIDICKSELLIKEALQSTTKIFVRHNKHYLYYGTHSDIGLDGHNRWVIRGYHFKPAGQPAGWFKEKVYLREFYGVDIGSSICFELDKKYFYALSNQTTMEVEEVDWTSCYHCVRFPLDSPHMALLERTNDKLMWRRQHLEGVIDDRWTKLHLDINECTGDMQIIETRNEYLNGSSTSQRTYYKTKVEFPEKSMEELISPPLKPSPQTSAMLAALTNDRLAWTVTSHDNPHFLPAQTRLPRDMHKGNDESRLVYSQIKMSYYNTSASSFMDLANDTTLLEPQQAQRLRLRVGSRRLGASAKTTDHISKRDMGALEDTYIDNPIRFWPPEHDDCKKLDAALEDLYSLLNPPNLLGNVEATADERSIVYMTGKKGKLRAIILINFDPAVKLVGLRKWHGDRSLAGCRSNRKTSDKGSSSGSVGELEAGASKGLLGQQYVGGGAKFCGKGCTKVAEPRKDDVIDLTAEEQSKWSESQWMRKEPPMYQAIQMGFDFGW